MIDGRTVIAWTPYGRVKTVSILAPYMLRDHRAGIVDEWHLFMNCQDPADIPYAHELAAAFDWVKLLERPADCPKLQPVQRNTGYAIRYFTDPDAVYVRLDDDIIYLHPDSLLNLCESKIRTTSVLGCFGLTWNNAIISWFEQQVGVIPDTWGTVRQPYCMDAVGWASGDFAVGIHGLLLDILEGPDPDREVKSVYLYQNMPLAPRQQFSVSYHAVLGSDYCELDPPGHLDYPEEEHWLTVHRPEVVGKGNVIVGDALAAHWTFRPQRNSPEHAAALDVILDRYRALAERL